MCLFLHNLGDSFVSLLVEPIAGKNVSPSEKQLWRFSKNVLVAEKSQCKALSIGRHLEISSLLLMSAENTETLTFVSLKFLGFVQITASSTLLSKCLPLIMCTFKRFVIIF